MQLQTGDPQVLTTALLAEPADALQGCTLERLGRGVLQNQTRVSSGVSLDPPAPGFMDVEETDRD